MGDNGEGKTTLLNLLAGLDHPTNGSIHRKGELRIGYLPQHPGTDSGSDSTPRESMLEAFSPGELEMPVRHLSGGQRTRSLLARLLLQESELLLLVNRPTLDLEATEWLEG